MRIGGPNKPYRVAGETYQPLTGDGPFRERGLASWYGRQFHGQPTASGEVYDMYAMTAAHPTLPIPSFARVRNPANGRAVIVRINDRGPFRSGRIVDLSYTAALKLDILAGLRPVEIERITDDDIRTGAWQQQDPRWAVAGAAASLPSSSTPWPLTPSSPPPPPIPPFSPSTPAPPLTPVVASGAEVGVNRSVAEAPPARPTAAASAWAGASAAPAAGDRSSAPAEPAVVPPPTYWVQLGAFRQAAGAAAFQQQIQSQVGELAPLLTVLDEATLYKLQAGPYRSREEARGAAARLHAMLQLVPVVVERR